jgi:hypothetical protein
MRPTLIAIIATPSSRIQDKTCTFSSILASPLRFLRLLDHSTRRDLLHVHATYRMGSGTVQSAFQQVLFLQVPAGQWGRLSA